MATTKVTSEVLDLNAGRADYSLSATNTVTYVGASGGNQYVFNGAYGTYGVVNGTYVLSAVSSSHPIAIINNGKTSLISYTGAVNEGTGTGPDGNTYTFYSGDVTITVSGNFDTVSYYCLNHGYMGGKDNLIYTNSIGEFGLKMPSGTLLNRPTEVTGQIRNNTDETSSGSSSAMEYYNGTEWKVISCIGLPMAYLVVAGGGGSQSAGADGPAGGGAGGLRTSYGSTSGGGASAESNITLAAGTYTITVGAGGAANSYNNGSDSSIAATGLTTITSDGGGAGAGSSQRDGSDGGSGGGGEGDGSNFSSGGSATAGQGFDGGNGGSPFDVNRGGGGGGGAAAAGSNGGNGFGGSGGNGLECSITGSATYYAGGGAGDVQSGSAGSGGLGGGGAVESDGAANTGGGAGSPNGYSYSPNPGTPRSGGSGVVILRLATAVYSGTTTGSPTVTTDGSDTILTFTGSGTYVH